MEVVSNTAEDLLISGLSYKLEPGASYVVSKRNSSFYSSGAQEYISGQGARVIRISLNGEGWLDPSTVRLLMTVNSKDTTTNHTLRLISPRGVFSGAQGVYIKERS